MSICFRSPWRQSKHPKTHNKVSAPSTRSLKYMMEKLWIVELCMVQTMLILQIILKTEMSTFLRQPLRP